jgi:hypothetical protein
MSQRYYWEFDKERGCNIFDRKQPGDQYTGPEKVAWVDDVRLVEMIVERLDVYDAALRHLADIRKFVKNA